MKCTYKVKREFIDGKRTDKVNIFIELLSCDMIDENMLTTVMHFFDAYCKKYPDYYLYPDRVESFDKEFGETAIAASKEFYESAEENGEPIETNKRDKT